MRPHVLTLEYASPPLSLNYRLNRWEANRRSRALLDSATYWARAVRNVHPEMRRLEPIEVTLTWVVPDRRKRDEDNPVPTLKALCDGLVLGGLVPDDTPQYMRKNMPRIEYRPGSIPHLELSVVLANLD